MGAIQLRERLHQYIDTADERKLHAIYTLVEDGIREKNDYTKEELDEIYKLRTDYRDGKEEAINYSNFRFKIEDLKFNRDEINER